MFVFKSRRFQSAVSSIVRSLIAISVVASISSKGEARPSEPALIEPAKDAAYLATLGLDSNAWGDTVVNILVVGQDGQTSFHKGQKHIRPNGEKTNDLSSHADGNMLLSFNKRTGQVSIISLYRGYLVHDDDWAGVEDTPAVAAPSGMSERYLANYYLYAGRAKYLTYARSQLELFIRSRRLEKQYLTNDRLKIQGLVETDFGGFKKAMNGFMDTFSSSLRVAWAMKGNAGALFEMMTNRGDIMRALRSEEGFQKMTPKRQAELANDPARAILGTLRERQRYDGGGYQRSFNHAKFISYVLGLVGYTMAEAEFPDFLKEPAIVKTFETLSRSFDLKTFDQNLRLPDRNLHMITRAGFNNGESPMYLINVGTSIGNYAVYHAGRFAVLNGTGYITQVDPKIQIIPKPNDCPACLAR
ncbi:hypothetical protein BH10BDE1_BH10BDE1_06410 [soil metagenome]